MWMAIHGEIFDVTAFKDDHPGGPEIMHENSGAYRHTYKRMRAKNLFFVSMCEQNFKSVV